MKYLLGFVVLCSATCLYGTQFRCDYTYFSQIDAWLKLQKVPANWHEAMLHCHFEGSHLASPLNADIQDVMKSLINTNKASKYAFTGIHEMFSRGNLHSIEGVPLFKIPHTWAAGEPDNYNYDKSCIAMQSDGALAFVNCGEPLPYICYKKNENGMFLHECGTVDSEYYFDSRTGSCYKFHEEPRTWSRAYMVCSDEGGHLAIINSDVEATVIKELFEKHPAQYMPGNFWKDVAFMGFHDWGEKGGEFITVHGETLKQAGYWKWAPRQPDNTTKEYCGAVFRSAELDDLLCVNRNAFICEKAPNSLLCDDTDILRPTRSANRQP